MAAMKVVFLAPSYPPEMQQYTRGLAEVGAEVYGVGDADQLAEQRRVVATRRFLHDANEPHVGERGRGAREAHRGLEWKRCHERDGAHRAAL